MKMEAKEKDPRRGPRMEISTIPSRNILTKRKMSAIIYICKIKKGQLIWLSTEDVRS